MNFIAMVGSFIVGGVVGVLLMGIVACAHKNDRDER